MCCKEFFSLLQFSPSPFLIVPPVVPNAGSVLQAQRLFRSLPKTVRPVVQVSSFSHVAYSNYMKALVILNLAIGHPHDKSYSRKHDEISFGVDQYMNKGLCWRSKSVFPQYTYETQMMSIFFDRNAQAFPSNHVSDLQQWFLSGSQGPGELWPVSWKPLLPCEWSLP